MLQEHGFDKVAEDYELLDLNQRLKPSITCPRCKNVENISLTERYVQTYHYTQINGIVTPGYATELRRLNKTVKCQCGRCGYRWEFEGSAI